MKLTYRGFVDREYFSRYARDRVIDDGENLYLEYDSKIDISGLSYVTHKVTRAEEGRLTVIANNYYGNPLYWWFISLMNNVIDPINYPVAGTEIKIPYKDEIIRLFNRERK